MAKTKKSKTSELKADADHAVMTLTMDSFDGEPREVTPPQEEAFQTPCTLSGVAAGLSGGTLGYVFGFGKHFFIQPLLLPLPTLHVLQARQLFFVYKIERPLG